MTNKIYFNIFITIVTLLSLYVYNLYKGKRMTFRKDNFGLVAFLCLLGTIFFANRPFYEDTKAYARVYETWSDMPFSFTTDTNNILFDNLMHLMARTGLSVESFFAVIAAIYLFCCAWSCKKIFPNHSLLAFIVFLGAFSTYSYAVNGIKAGAAASVFMCAIAYRDKWYVALPLCFVSWGFHHSMHVCLAAFLMVFYIKNPKYYLTIWIAFLICSALHFTFLQSVFADLTDEKGSGYFEISSEIWSGKKGFRTDFVLYSVVPVILGWKVYIKEKIEDALGIFIFNIYTILNSIWLMCMYIAFTNRIAYFSWSLYPIALLYPVLILSRKKNSYKYTMLAVTLHLGFTLAMHLIYYA